MKAQSVVGMRRRCSGGLGNRLFQVSLLQALGETAKCDVRRPLDDGVRSLESAEMRFEPGRLILGRVVPNDMMKRGSFSEVCDFVFTCQESGSPVIVPPGGLGPFFRGANDAVGLRKYFKSGFQLAEPKFRILFHFRGGDFHPWDLSAVMSPQFYSAAIDEINAYDETTVGLETAVVSDDHFHPTVDALKQKLGTHPLNGSQETDFKRLTAASYVVAAPSTFSFWAAFLGSAVWVISRSWFENSLNQPDLDRQRFWRDLEERECFRGRTTIGFQL